MTIPGPDLRFGYPDGYRDPLWDGTVADYRDIVLPARMAAIRESLDTMLGDLGFPDLHWEWATGRDGETMAVPAPWPGYLDPDDRALMIRELRSAVDVLEKSGRAETLEGVLAAWRTTAEALADPDRRAVLTGPLKPEDFTEVGPP